MASINKRGDGWRVRWRDPDGSARSRQCPTRRSAKALVREIEEARAVGRRWTPAGVRKEPPLEEVAEAFLRAKSRTLQPSSIQAMASRIGRLLEYYEAIEVTPTVKDLSREHLGAAYSYLRTPDTMHRRRASATSTANLACRVWEAMWAWAWDSDEYGGQCPRPRKLELARSLQQPVIAPTWGEVDAMLHHLLSRQRDGTDWADRVALIQRYTGCRVGAARELLWSDVDLDGGVIRFRAEAVKTARGRAIPLHSGLRDLLATWGARQGRVCGIDGPIRPIHRSAGSKFMKTAWRRSGVRPEAWAKRPSHCMRRAWRSGLMAQRVNPEIIDVLLGHVTRSTGASRYTDLTMVWPQMVEAVESVPAVGASEERVLRFHPGGR